MSKRGINIYRRKDGRWEGRVLQNKNPGKLRTYKSFYGKTYSEVKRKMEHFIKENKQEPVKCSVTIDEAINRWLENGKEYWKATTYATYYFICRKYIIPLWGNQKAACISGDDMNRFAGEIQFGNNGKKLSAQHRHNIISVLLRGLSFACKKYGYHISLPENPIPVPRTSPMILPSEQDMSRLEEYLLLNADKSTNMGILIAFYTGIRIGELSALTWKDIDLEENVIHIRKNLQRVKTFDGQGNQTKIVVQNPKTENSNRIIPIPPILLKQLKKYRGTEQEYVIKGKKHAFAEARTLQYRFTGILNTLKISKFHFHMLRHAFATQCINKGFDIKSVSELLGHSNVQITLKLYVHSTLRHKKTLMNLFTNQVYMTRNQQPVF